MNWGIVSASKIANRFIEALKLSGENVYAIASRDVDKAKKLCEIYAIEYVYETYSELFADEEIDVVYISNVNNMHCETVIAALEAGCNVVCEKPLSVSQSEADHMFHESTKRGLYLTEALWTRFLPIYKNIREIIAKGEIGEVIQVRTDFSFVAERNEKWRLLNQQLGGGALYDIGIYSLMFIFDFLGIDVKHVAASGYIGSTGVDEESMVLINYSDGKMAVMYNSFIMNKTRLGVIIGTKGQITVPDFYAATTATVSFFDNQPSYCIKCEDVPNKFIYEVKNIVEDLNTGMKESAMVPMSHSKKASEVIDMALQQLMEEANDRR